MVAGYSIGSNENPNLYSLNQGKVINKMKKDLFISRITGGMGYRYKKTCDVIEWIDSINPD